MGSGDPVSPDSHLPASGSVPLWGWGLTLHGAGHASPSRGEGLTLGLVWDRLALQLAGLQRTAELHADDVDLRLTVLQHLLGRQQQLPVLEAGKGCQGKARDLGSDRRPPVPTAQAVVAVSQSRRYGCDSSNICAFPGVEGRSGPWPLNPSHRTPG